jgi:hypothetical protein
VPCDATKALRRFMIEMLLSKGYVTTISDRDYKRVSKLKWYAHEKRRADGSLKNVYAQCTYRHHGAVKILLLHRFILGVTDPSVEVDHKDHDGLRNCRSNLRRSTGQQNKQHSRTRTDNTSGFKGVYWNTKMEIWEACIKVNGKNKWLGAYLDKKYAALAYDRAARKQFGKFAVTNY